MIGREEGLNEHGLGVLRQKFAQIQEMIPAARADVVGFIENIRGAKTEADDPALFGGRQLGLAQTTLNNTKKIFLGTLEDVSGMSAQEITDVHSFVFGHEMWHTVDQDFQKGLLKGSLGKKWEQFVDWSDKADNQEIVDFLGLMEEMLPERLRNNFEVRELLKNTQGAELRANAGALWAMTAMNGGVDVEMGTSLMPVAPRKALNAVSTFVKRIARSVKGAFGARPESDAQAQWDKVSKLFEDFQTESQKAEGKLAEFSTLAHVDSERMLSNAIPPDGTGDIVELMNPALVSLRKKAVPEGETVIDKGIFSPVMKFLGDIAEAPTQMAARIPAFARSVAALHNHGSHVAAGQHEVMNHIVEAGETGKLSKGEYSDDYFKINNASGKADPKMSQFMSDLMLAQNDISQIINFDKGGSGLPGNFGSRFREFSSQDRDVLKNMYDRHVKASLQKNQKIELANLEETKYEVAGILSDVLPPELWSSSFGLSSRMVDAKKKIYSETAVQEGIAEIQMLQAEMQGAGDPRMAAAFERLEEAADGFVNIHQRKVNDIAQNPVHFNDRMFGKYRLNWTNKDGSKGTFSFPSMAEMRRFKDKKREEGKTGFQEIDQGEALFESNPDPVQQSAHDKALIDKEAFIRNLKLSEELELALLEDAKDLGTAYNESAQLNKDVSPKDKISAAQGGKEMIDMVENFRLDSHVGIRVAEDQLLRTRLKYELSNPEMSKFPVERKRMQRAYENYMHPDTAAGRLLTQAVFTKFMGLNLSNHMLELVQPVFSFLPHMQAMGIGTIKSNKMILDASVDAQKFNMQKLKQGKNWETETDWANSGIKDGEELGPLMMEMSKRGRISLGPAAEVDSPQYHTALGANHAMKTGKSATLGRLIKKPFTAFHDLSVNVYSAFTHQNARSSAMIGWRLAKEQNPGLKTWTKDPNGKKVLNPELVEATEAFMLTTNFSGGRADRPVALGAGGAFRTPGMAMNALQSFSNGTLSMMARHAQHAYGGKHLDITPAQRKAARKALNTQMAVAFASSGALGMPFMGALIATLENNTELEIHKGLREKVAAMFGEDEGDGGFLTKVTLEGLANTVLGGTPLPADVGSRFAVGGVVGTDAYKGFAPEAVFGATGSMATSLVQGGRAIAQGDVAKGLEDIAPISMKKVMNLIRNEGQVIDNYGQKILDPTGGELFSLAIGFNPQRVRNVRDVNRIQTRTREIQRKKDIRKANELAEQFESDPGAVAAELRKMEEDSDGLISARAWGNRIAERIEKKTFGLDPRREATAVSSKSEQQFLAATGSLGTAPTELSRIQLQDQVLKILGFQPSRSQASVQQARLMDVLMGSDPTMTRMQAKEVAEREQGGAFKKTNAFSGQQSPFSF